MSEFVVHSVPRTRFGRAMLATLEEQNAAYHLLLRPELAVDPRFAGNIARCEHREALTALIEASFTDKTTGDVVKLLDRYR
jgi:crotonobetainyl-CoA:carnitine CoA-transferase CaiB-like acyl-CoA transferase